LGVTRPRPEVGIGLCLGQSFGQTGHTDLAVHRLPVEAQRGPRVVVDLPALVGVVVGEEHEPVGDDLFAEDRAHVGLAVLIDRGHCHGIGLFDTRGVGLLEPSLELQQRTCGQILLQQGP